VPNEPKRGVGQFIKKLLHHLLATSTALDWNLGQGTVEQRRREPSLPHEGDSRSIGLELDQHVADSSFADRYVKQIPDLIHMTGPSAYDYQFGADRRLFDPFIETAWLEPNTLFSHTEATLEIENDELIGIEIGFGGRNWYELKKPLGGISARLLESGRTTREALSLMGKHSRIASYMNPYIPETAYYVLALAISDSHRGQGLGAKLLSNAIETARIAGYRELHLDVLSDNPAVKFYESMGLICMAETIAPEPYREHGVPMEMRMVLRL